MSGVVSPALCFAYGSNLHPRRIGGRIASARLVATGSVPGRRLAFHKVGMDGSAKCDAPRGRGRVYGALYALDEDDWPLLDGYEGCGAGYERAPLEVRVGDEVVQATTYLAQPGHIDPELRPYDWYIRLVVAGAVYHRFPSEYIEEIAAVPACVDPDEERAAEIWAMLEEWG